MKTVSFYTFGCRLNQSETAALQNSFAASGYQVVGSDRPAEICVINTCTVTAQGDADTRRMVNKIQRLNPGTQIALIGCQSQIQKEQLLKLPNVRWVVGTAQKMDLAKIITESSAEAGPLLLTSAIPRDSFTMAFGGLDRQHTRANIKIQDGCDFFCSFCEIPYARGRARSRQLADILKEAQILADNGYQEVVLTGINMGTYNHEQADILAVIESIQRLAGIRRIRLSSLELTTFPDKILDYMLPAGKLCRYLHIPLQHGSDRILHLMKRKYTSGEYQRFTQKATREVPELCLGTDVIVGFPGETDDDFEATYHLLRDSPVCYLHVFSYSARQMAKSRNLPNPVPANVVKQRSERLRQLSNTKRRQFYNRFTGKDVDVLFEEKRNGGWWGFTDNYIRIKVNSGAELRNQYRTVRINGVSQSAMTADVI